MFNFVVPPIKVRSISEASAYVPGKQKLEITILILRISDDYSSVARKAWVSMQSNYAV